MWGAALGALISIFCGAASNEFGFLPLGLSNCRHEAETRTMNFVSDGVFIQDASEQPKCVHLEVVIGQQRCEPITGCFSENLNLIWSKSEPGFMRIARVRVGNGRSRIATSFVPRVIKVVFHRSCSHARRRVDEHEPTFCDSVTSVPDPYANREVEVPVFVGGAEVPNCLNRFSGDPWPVRCEQRSGLVGCCGCRCLYRSIGLPHFVDLRDYSQASIKQYSDG